MKQVFQKVGRYKQVNEFVLVFKVILIKGHFPKAKSEVSNRNVNGPLVSISWGIL